MTPEQERACKLVDDFSEETSYFLEIARTLREGFAAAQAERDAALAKLNLAMKVVEAAIGTAADAQESDSEFKELWAVLDHTEDPT